jgi:hypothetical protein
MLIYDATAFSIYAVGQATNSNGLRPSIIFYDQLFRYADCFTKACQDTRPDISYKILMMITTHIKDGLPEFTSLRILIFNKHGIGKKTFEMIFLDVNPGSSLQGFVCWETPGLSHSKRHLCEPVFHIF